MVNSQDDPTEPALPAPPDADQQEDKLRKRKDKIRSAWISFVGRIIAQILGAVATITLGLALADRIRNDANRSADAASVTSPGQLPAAVFPPHDSRPSIAVLPLELYSPDSTHQYLADSLTEELVAALTSGRALRVVSRTSSRQYQQHARSVPEIAAALRVDIVVEGGVFEEGDRIRIRLRALDGARDAHVGTVVREGRTRDLPARRADIASSAAQELADIVLGYLR